MRIWLFAQQLDQNQLNIPKPDFTNDTVPNALRLVFGLAGAIALLIITIAGFQYVMARGNPQDAAKAKNAILYALIGLIVCMFAITIVTFVAGRF